MNDKFYQELIEHIPDGVYFVDRAKRITFWNKGAEKITGYTKEEVVGFCCADNILKHIDDCGHELCLVGCPLSQTLLHKNNLEVDVYLHHKDGHRVPVSVRVSPILNEEGEVVGAVEVFSDNSQKINQIKELENLRKEVFIDALTQVGNRKFLEIKLDYRWQEMGLYNIPFGILFLDIDRFKKFNDTYGHEIGDRVLLMVTKTISNLIRGMDVIARWGGEEFVVIVTNVDGQKLAKVAERIRIFIEKSWLTVNEENIRVTVSIGATLARKDDTIQSLIKRADELMYQSKESGRNRVTLDENFSSLFSPLSQEVEEEKESIPFL